MSSMPHYPRKKKKCIRKAVASFYKQLAANPVMLDSLDKLFLMPNGGMEFNGVLYEKGASPFLNTKPNITA